MDNPTLILQTVDKYLDHEIQLVIYGRAALWLGFDSPPSETSITRDVDAIISIIQEKELLADFQFWDAIEKANVELASRGLYITHLFSEREVFLRMTWQEALVQIFRPATERLRLFRPATIDLILTKMMRGDDPQDMADAAFMIRHDRVSVSMLERAFAEMKPIALLELKEAFARAKPIVLGVAKEFSNA